MKEASLLVKIIGLLSLILPSFIVISPLEITFTPSIEEFSIISNLPAQSIVRPFSPCNNMF